jgi:hypothetical protein
MKRLKDMEETLLKKDEVQAQEKSTQRKNKKRKIMKQEEIISERIQEYVLENENILKGELQTFKNEKE